MTKQRIKELLEIGKEKIFVVAGDLILDEWLLGTSTRISPEAPVPIVQIDRRVVKPGGTANVAANIKALGGIVRLVGVEGGDKEGIEITDLLINNEVGNDYLVRDFKNPTTLKTRIIANSHHVVRLDKETERPYQEPTIRRLNESLIEALEGADCLCVSDYNKGVIKALKFNQAEELMFTAGPKPNNTQQFYKVDFLSFNYKEACEVLGPNYNKLDVYNFINVHKINCLAITRSEAGVDLHIVGKNKINIPSKAVEVFDVAGAGDTFLAAATFALTSGADYIEAAELGIIASGLAVKHHNVVSISAEEILNSL